MKQGNGCDSGYHSAVASRQFESKLLSIQQFDTFLAITTSFSPDAHAQKVDPASFSAPHQAAQVQQNRTATKKRH